MYRMIAVCLALNSLVLLLPLPSHAVLVVDRDWAFIDNRPVDDIFGITDLRLNLTVRATDSVAALTGPGSGATVVSSNAAFPFPTPRNVPLNAVFLILGGAEFSTFPPLTGVGQFPSVTGTYTYTVTNTSAQSVTSTTHLLDKLEVIPIPTSLVFSDFSTTPVFTFSDPDPTPEITGLNRRYQVDIFDSSKINIFQSASLLTPSFAVPAGILETGHNYYFRAVSLDFDPSDFCGAACVHSNLENRAIAYTTLEVPAAVPEPSTLLLFGTGLIGLAGLARTRLFLK